MVTVLAVIAAGHSTALRPGPPAAFALHCAPALGPDAQASPLCRQFARPSVAPLLRHAPCLGSTRMASDEGGVSAAANVAADAALRLVLSRRAALRTAIAASVASAAMCAPKPAEASLVDPAAAAPATDKADPLGFATGFNVAPGKKVVLPGGTVRSSALDRRSYRALTLPNGLRVLLASDPKADTAAAALDVHVGHFSDPDEACALRDHPSAPSAPRAPLIRLCHFPHLHARSWAPGALDEGRTRTQRRRSTPNQNPKPKLCADPAIPCPKHRAALRPHAPPPARSPASRTSASTCSSSARTSTRQRVTWTSACPLCECSASPSVSDQSSLLGTRPRFLALSSALERVSTLERVSLG